MVPSLWWLVLFILFILSVLVQNYLLSALAIMLALLTWITKWWNSQSLKDVHYTRNLHYTRGYPGESFEVHLELENRKLLPVSWLLVKDLWSRHVSPEEDILDTSHIDDTGILKGMFRLLWYERIRRKFKIILRKRGFHALGPVSLESGDLFGILTDKKTIDHQQFISVFPEILPSGFSPELTDGPFGVRKAQRRLFEDPNQTMGIRNYHPEDDFRRIHWTATARTGTLKVKVYQPSSAPIMVICLNVSTFYNFWDGIDPELLEYLISLTATIIERAVLDGYRIGLISNGSLSNSDQPFKILPGRSKNQFPKLMELLAGVSPYITGKFENLLIKEAPSIPYGSDIYVITAIHKTEIEAGILTLKRKGRRITMVSVSDDPPEFIPGVKIIHRPFYRNEPV